jgi:mycofactocin system glycosyltransferase
MAAAVVTGPRPARFALDRSYQRHGDTVVGGSPLKLFRLTPAGVAVMKTLERCGEISPSELSDRLIDAGVMHPQPLMSERFSAADVTVVIPVHRRTGTAHEARPARAGLEAEVAVLVVDDGSVPALPEADLRITPNQGPAAARNAGLARVTSELVAFVDDDVELPAGWLTGLLAHFDDERVALVAPRVVSASDPPPVAGRMARGLRSVMHRHERGHSPLDLGEEPARIRSGTRVSYVPAAVILCRVEALTSIGGFDQGFRFGEDVDLVWRLDSAGWRCRYEPAVTARHAVRSSWGAWARQRIGYGSSAAPLARKHPRALAPARMSGYSAVAWGLVATGHVFTGAAVGATSAAALIRVLPQLPAPVAFGIAASGNLRAGPMLADAVRRAWWPVLAVAALRSRTARRVLAISVLAARSPVKVLDDFCYSLGVWRGSLRERTLGAVLPSFSSWPGRTSGR